MNLRETFSPDVSVDREDGVDGEDNAVEVSYLPRRLCNAWRLSVCLSVCLLGTSFREVFSQMYLVKEELIKFWKSVSSGS